ncbi:hypothetical protein MTO96_026501 [Rhipicephalus appendiculatus]
MKKAKLSGLMRDRLKRTQTLDGFIRFAAVVKETVVCRTPDDGRTQLDALNEDCWRHVRQYLVLDDVKQGMLPPIRPYATGRSHTTRTRGRFRENGSPLW